LRRRLVDAAQLRVVSAVQYDRRGRGRFFTRLMECESVKALVVASSTVGPLEAIRPGMHIAAAGLLRPPRPARNPGEFDERGWLAARGVALILQARRIDIVSEPIAWRYKIRFWAANARRSLQECVTATLTHDDAGLMQGILLGDSGAVPRAMARSVQDAGGMHLLAPSGAKVAFIMWIAFIASSVLSAPPVARAASAALAGGFYTVMVGADPPYERACFGALAVIVSRLIDREADLLQAACISALVIMAVEPRDAFTAGFAMTYAAVLALAAAAPRLRAAIPEKKRSWPKKLVLIALSSLVVQAALWPTFARYFHRGSLVGAAANIVLIPLAAVMMGAGLSLWAAQLAGACALGLAVPAVHALCWIFMRLCAAAAALPLAAIDLSPMTAAEVIAWYLFMGALLALPRRRIAAAMAVGALGFWAASAYAARAAPLRIVLLHVPRGQTAILSFNGGRHWLIGAQGPAATVLAAMKALNIARLNKVVVLGRRPQESRALPRILEALPVGAVETVARTWTWCCGQVCLDMGLAQGPRLRRLDREFSIIPVRLRTSALKVVTDGLAVSISNATQ
jgi:competence protein ComEC